ncbi:Glucans biosynthesis protein C [Planctomycetes bacterium CA13]|uniref:Glucans biosynthesis protein C n=1 Tax=Novipirellula herctigrandis TaxID=2527986 RepID=A0A5C5Z157_9BACT|nr:Glucans biosynthesis protein C [Planctomycetes bacterium CA13]
MPLAAPVNDSRRHDLDALRAVAMLLGIVLHATLSFIPGPNVWVVRDTQSSEVFGLFLGAIHGFRMPLFFLLSGFFTMMLFRKRGIKSLLVHRFKRIFLPMMIGLFTIIPATWIVSAYVNSKVNSSESTSSKIENADVLMATAMGNSRRIEQLLDEGVDVDTTDDKGTTPLMLAALFGRSEAAELLIDRGANVSAKTKKGETVEMMLHVNYELTEWIGSLLDIDLAREAVEQGRIEIALMLPPGELTGVDLKSEAIETDPLEAGMTGLLAALYYIPVFGHLWFLWFLCWFVIGFSVLVPIGKLISWPQLSRGYSALIAKSRSWVSCLWLIPITMIPQSFMGDQGLGFGPDTSIGLLPIPAVFAYYAIFFAFGAIYYDAADDQGQMGRHWAVTIPFCLLVLFPIGLSTAQHLEGIGRVTNVFVQVAYAWLLSFGLMGVFGRYFPTKSNTMRYLSDSSYWLYLAHIPLIILVQYWVREYEISSFVKFPLVCLITTGILLVSYHWLVRYTPIGTLLNGKRTRISKSEPVIEASLMESAQTPAQELAGSQPRQ